MTSEADFKTLLMENEAVLVDERSEAIPTVGLYLASRHGLMFERIITPDTVTYWKSYEIFANGAVQPYQFLALNDAYAMYLAFVRDFE